MIAGDMQAMTDVSEMAQKLMNSFEDAMAIMDHADTESAAYDQASAAFEEAPSQLEELGFEYEITSEGVSFSRSGTAVEEHDPATRIGAVPFLGLSGTSEVGSLDQVIDVSDFKSLNRFLVLLVCPKSKVKGAKSTYYKFCANPFERMASYTAHLELRQELKDGARLHPLLRDATRRGAQETGRRSDRS
jgi:hypothetical protein